MAGDHDDRYGSDLRDSSQPRSWSDHRSPDEDGREGSPTDAREVKGNGERYREVSSGAPSFICASNFSLKALL
jgi:hypothetical protein